MISILKRSNKSILGLVLAWAIVIALGGCSFMGARTPSRTFVLDPGKPSAVRTIAGRASISFVDIPGQSGFGNFLYRLTDSDWETDPYNRFLSSPQEMMTGVVRTWLTDSRQFTGVLMPGEGGTADLRIDVEVSELYIDFRNPAAPEAVISMEVALHRLANSGVGSRLMKQTFSARVPVADRTPEAFVQAWEFALRKNLVSLSSSLGSVSR